MPPTPSGSAIAFAFECWACTAIEGHTMNPAMRRVYEKCGYRHEGVARAKFWRDGRWLDADLFAILGGPIWLGGPTTRE